jgi:hypothetical protein
MPNPDSTLGQLWHIAFLFPCLGLVLCGEPIGWLLIGMWMGRFM